ncbi:MAG: hypothetical protein MJ154_03390 [Candidatus Saccharibacteria bacterium]|nr:hypothetical protein [Candidatus Saccharibacteria bacterium]
MLLVILFYVACMFPETAIDVCTRMQNGKFGNVSFIPDSIKGSMEAYVAKNANVLLGKPVHVMLNGTNGAKIKVFFRDDDFEQSISIMVEGYELLNTLRTFSYAGIYLALPFIENTLRAPKPVYQLHREDIPLLMPVFKRFYDQIANCSATQLTRCEDVTITIRNKNEHDLACVLWNIETSGITKSFSIRTRNGFHIKFVVCDDRKETDDVLKIIPSLVSSFLNSEMGSL